MCGGIQKKKATFSSSVPVCPRLSPSVPVCPRLSPQDEEFRARPRLDIIQPLPEGSEEISSDALTVRNFQDNECRDYRLGETIKTAPGEMSRSL